MAQICANLCHLGLGLSLLCACEASVTENALGSAGGGALGMGGTDGLGGANSGGASNVGGGTSSLSGTSTGGALGMGGTDGLGGANSGGASNVGGSTSCVPYNADLQPLCADDKDCPATSYCDQSHFITGVCTCDSNGQSQCGESFGYHCQTYSTSCTRAAAAFTNQLKGESCTVIVRASADGAQMNGYATVCGALNPTAAPEALNQLLTMSSINWSGATLLSSTTNTGIIGYTTSTSQYSYAAYISANTGQTLLITRTALDSSATSSFSIGTWGPSSDLGTACSSGEQSQFQQINQHGIGNVDSINNNSVTNPLLKTDLLRALRQAAMPSLSLGVSLASVAGPELLLFVTSPGSL